MREETLKKKKEVIDEIKSNIEKAKSVVLVDYIGLNVSDLTELRADYRKNGVVYKVYKNNFMKFAFEEIMLARYAFLLDMAFFVMAIGGIVRRDFFHRTFLLRFLLFPPYLFLVFPFVLWFYKLQTK